MIPLLDISTGWKTAIMIVAMIIVFYFFIIRPQSKQAKAEADYRDSLKKGDAIMTTGGIHATFISYDNAMAIIEVAPGVRWKIQKAAIAPVVGKKK